METLRAIWAIIVIFWNTGNRYARIAIVMIVFPPFILALIASSGLRELISIVALLPIFGIVFLLLAMLDPLVVAVVVAFHQGRRILRWIATIVGAELVIGVYFSVVPVWNDRGLIPLAFLIAATLLLLSFGAGVAGQRILKITINILLILFVLLTAIFFLGGRESGGEKLKNLYQTVVVVKKPKPVCEPCLKPEANIIALKRNEVLSYSLDINEATPWIEVPEGVIYNIHPRKKGHYRVYYWNGKVVDVGKKDVGLPDIYPTKFKVVSMGGPETYIISGL